MKVFRTEPAAPMPYEPFPLCQELPALCHQLKGFQNVAVYTVFGVKLKIERRGCVVYLYILYITTRPFFRYPRGGWVSQAVAMHNRYTTQPARLLNGPGLPDLPLMYSAGRQSAYSQHYIVILTNDSPKIPIERNKNNIWWRSLTLTCL